MEIIVAPNTIFVNARILIGSTANLGHGLNEVLARKKLSRNSGLPTTTTGH
jgi:hypothetical protein